MKIAVYADDPREPDLIGDATVDLTEVLTKGETDGEYLIAYLSSHHSLYCRMVHALEQGKVFRRSISRTYILVKRMNSVFLSRTIPDKIP